MSNFLKRTKRASEEIAYDDFHKGMKENNVIGTNYEGQGKMYSGKEVSEMMKGSYKAGLKDGVILQETSEQEVNMLKEKCRLLRKALTRMVAEFDTTTPIIPNQKLAVKYANNLLNGNDE